MIQPNNQAEWVSLAQTLLTGTVKLFSWLLKFLSTRPFGPLFTVNWPLGFVVSTRGESSMTADILPSIFVPLTGVIMPAIAMAFLFIYIEREDASGI